MDQHALVSKLRAFNEACRELQQATELQRLYERIIDAIWDLFDCHNCAVLLLDRERLELRIAAARGYEAEVVQGFRAALGQGISGTVAQSGQRLYVPDVRADRRYIMGVANAACELATPLVVKGAVIGVLDVESDRAGAFGALELELFDAFATSAAAAIDNLLAAGRVRRNELELTARLHELLALARVGDAIVATLDLERLLADVLRVAAEVLPFQRCAILLRDRADDQRLVVVAARGYAEDVRGKPIRFGAGITGRVAASREPLLVPDVERDERYIRGVAGGRCEMAVPLLVGEQLLGVIDAEHTAPDAFDAQDLSLLRTFASHVAVAVRNAQLVGDLERTTRDLERHVLEIERMNAELADYAEKIRTANFDLQRRVRELLTVHEASKAITSSLDLDETLRAIVAMTQQIIPNAVSSIKLRDEASGALRVRTQWRGAAAADLPEEGLRSRMIAPLLVGQRTIGVFEIAAEPPDAFGPQDQQLLQTLAGQAAIAIENARLFEEAQRTYFETIRSLAQALEARDAYTRGHSERVTAYALALARAVGVEPARLKLIEHAGLLHDIGKIGISDTILNKPGALDGDDRRIIESHPSFGDAILGPLKFLDQVQGLVLHHHEHFDGTGYPGHLAGEQIPLEARIIAVADAYDAMTSDRPYRKALNHAQAVVELQRGAGTQFDPRLVAAFVDLAAAGGLEQLGSAGPAQDRGATAAGVAVVAGGPASIGPDHPAPSAGVPQPLRQPSASAATAEPRAPLAPLP